MKNIIYIIVATAFLGAKLFSVDIKIMSLSLYRLSLFFMMFYLILNNLLLDKKITIRIKDRQSLIIRFYFIWMIYAIYSLSWVLDLKLAIGDLFFIITGFLCIWLFSTFVKEERQFKNIFNTMFLMILFHNMLGWFELRTGRYFFADLKKIDRYNRFAYDKASRVPITIFSNVNDYATLMTFGVFISFIVFLNSKKLWMKGLSFATMASSAILILRTGSRGNMAGLALGIAAVGLLIILRKFSKSVLIAIGLIGIFVIAIYPPLNVRVIAILRNQIFSRFGSNSLRVRSDTTRMNLIKNGLIFLLSTIGFGTGVGNIEYWMETRPVFFVENVFNIHNWWVEILVGYGVMIFIGYILVYFIKAKTLFTAYLETRSAFIRNTSLGFFGFMIAFIISAVSSSSNINTEWLWLFWAVLIAFIGYIVKDIKKTSIVEIN